LSVTKRGDRFRLVAGLDDVMALRLQRELQHRAERVLVFDEQDRGALTRRDAASRRARPRGALRLQIRDGLVFCVELLLDALELGQGRLAILLDLGPLRRVVAVDEIGLERVDAALQRIGEDLQAAEGPSAPPSCGRPNRPGPSRTPEARRRPLGGRCCRVWQLPVPRRWTVAGAGGRATPLEMSGSGCRWCRPLAGLRTLLRRASSVLGDFGQRLGRTGSLPPSTVQTPESQRQPP
jgi:hypothetical protein